MTEQKSNNGSKGEKRDKRKRSKPRLSDTQRESPESLSADELAARRAEIARQEAKAKEQRYRSVLNESARLLKANRPGEAIKKLRPLLEEHPNDPDIAINLGGAYILQRKWRKAAQVLEQAAKENPDNAMIWTNLAAAYLGRLETAGPKHQEQAIAAYERALQADPNAPNVNYHLGLIHKERGDLNRAAAHFQRALEVNAADRDARYWLDKIGRLLSEQQLEKSNHSTGDEDAQPSLPLDDNSENRTPGDDHPDDEDPDSPRNGATE
jgi:tetratricopeptide (TPR) repeat protein